MENIKFEALNFLEKTNVGEDCNIILKSLLDGPEDKKSLAKRIESNCYTFYKIASQTIQKYLSYNDFRENRL